MVQKNSQDSNSIVIASDQSAVPVNCNIPPGATPQVGSSGNVANAAAAISFGGQAGKKHYITGFQITASGATAALVVNATITGLAGTTLTYAFTFPAGVAVAATPLVVTFNPPAQASDINTTVTLTLPAGGAGNTNASVCMSGYYV